MKNMFALALIPMLLVGCSSKKIGIPINDLYTAYQTDSAGTKLKYANTFIDINGVVTSKDSDPRGNTYLVFTVGDNDHLIAEGDTDFQTSTKQIDVNSSVSLHCKFRGDTPALALSNCEVNQ